MPENREEKPPKPKLSKLQICATILAVLISLSICAWQVGVCVSRYLDKPIGTEISVQLMPELTLPARLYICPEDGHLEVQRNFDLKCKENEGCDRPRFLARKLNFPFNQLNISMDELWSTNESVRFIFACSGLSTKNLCRLNQRWYGSNLEQVMDTLDGVCHVLNTTGIAWYPSAKSSELGYAMISTDGSKKIYMHNTPEIDKTVTPSAELMNGRESTFVISSIKEFHRLNSTSNLCSSANDFSNCRNECFDRYLKSFNDTFCSVPFLKPEGRKECSNLDDIFSFYNSFNLNFQLEMSKCDCNRPCTKIVYGTSLSEVRLPDDSPYYQNKIKLHLQISTDVKEIITEFYLYSIYALFSDLAGIVGFYLGISLVGLFQYLTYQCTNNRGLFCRKTNSIPS